MNLKDTLNLPRTEFPMRAGLPDKEPEILARWKERDIYARLRQARAGAPRYLLHDGPPYANGHIHLGTALNKILKDMVVRSRALAGFDVPFVPGWDCHGMPIEHRVIRKMGGEAAEAGTLEIRERCREYASRFVEVQRREFERLGAIGDWNRPYLTMDPTYEAEILRTFGELVDDGYVSKGLRSIHWCGTCETALAEAELEYANHVSPSIYVAFPLRTDEAAQRIVAPRLPDGSSVADVDLVIWTTTPWTIPANQAIAVHPDLEYVLVEVDASRWHDENGDPGRTGDDGRRFLVVAADLIGRMTAEIGTPEEATSVTTSWEGRELEGLSYRHPLFDRASPVILSEFVTLEQGSGLVHTAPGHGQEDFELGRRYGLEVLCPVDGAGVFDEDAGPFAGRQVFEANPDVVEALREAGALLADSPFEHSYPHCWRCKSPLIYRATEQWFLNVDTHELRDRLLSTIRQEVSWVPDWGRERIAGMVESRPDWCLSRQRHWGVPIPALYCSDCGKVRMDPAVVDRAVEVVSEEGSDAWFRRPAADFVPQGTRCDSCGGTEFVQERDIFDVWFESGVSHRAVLDPGGRRDAEGDPGEGGEGGDDGGPEGRRWPADLYLEGHDQHRGWFQVSLITGVSTRKGAPYRTVVTHGFVLDEDGHKMSKSRGNVIAPEEIWESYGADLMRLYFASVEYTRDVPFSEGLLEPVVESYRKIRNTLRFLLGNLHDFEPDRHRADPDAMEPVDRWILDRAAALGRQVTDDYEAFRFHRAVHRLHNFCAVSLSATYLDIVKDRLYCSRADDPGRRAAQTAQFLLADGLCRWLAPVIPFTTEEVWGYLPGDRGDSVHLARFPDLDEHALDDAERRRLEAVMEAREVVLGLLERAREEGKIGSSLEAAVYLRKEEDGEETPLDLYFDWLQEFFIVSRVHRLEADELLPPETVDGEERAVAGGWRVAVAPAQGEKCERCWMWRQSVGESEEHPTLCRRCVDVVRSITADNE